MNKSLQAMLGIVILVAGTTIFLLSALSYFLGSELLSSKEIEQRAEQNVPALVLPQAPVGQMVSETTNEKVITKVPRITGFPPKITFNEITTTVPRVVQRLVGPAKDEVDRWNAEVERLRLAHKSAVEAESSRISREQSTELRSTLKDIIQMLASLFGIVFGAANLWLGIRKERQENTKLKSN